jgi:cytoskeletal protein CcmA (bactofilin family)
VSSYFIPEKNHIDTVLEENTELDGNLSFSTSLEIKGKFKGTIFSKGLLVIAKTAQVEATIYSKDLIVEGFIKGDLIIHNKLEVEESAKILGNIKTHKIKVNDGVFFEGDCFTVSKDEITAIFEKATGHIIEKDSSNTEEKDLSEPSLKKKEKLDSPSMEPSLEIKEENKEAFITKNESSSSSRSSKKKKR